jgi:hypothetical protein
MAVVRGLSAGGHRHGVVEGGRSEALEQGEDSLLGKRPDVQLRHRRQHLVLQRATAAAQYSTAQHASIISTQPPRSLGLNSFVRFSSVPCVRPVQGKLIQPLIARHVRRGIDKFDKAGQVVMVNKHACVGRD